jgi:hypothetical protein
MLPGIERKAGWSLAEYAGRRRAGPGGGQWGYGVDQRAIKAVDDLRAKLPPGARELAEVPGVGPKGEERILRGIDVRIIRCGAPSPGRILPDACQWYPSCHLGLP